MYEEQRDRVVGNGDEMQRVAVEGRAEWCPCEEEMEGVDLVVRSHDRITE